MALEGTNLLDILDVRGGEGTGRLDRGEKVCEKNSLILRDPVSGGEISTHKIYGPATPDVGSAYGLPRNHPLWAPMDFEVRAIAQETEEERLEKLAKFEPKSSRELTKEQIEQVQNRNREYFQNKKDCDQRLEFIASRNGFQGEKKGYFFGTSGPKNSLGYHLDYVQMRALMTLDVGDRCEARYGPMIRYFNGMVTAVHDYDCTYDVRFEHGYSQRHIPCEQVRAKNWIGKIKQNEGIARSLMAANPLLETNDAAVQWYERLLLYERGEIDQEPLPPDAVFGTNSRSATYIGEQKNEDTPLNILLNIDLETAAKNAHSEAYKKIWDIEGRPHRSGPPVHLHWYGRELPSAADGDLCGDGSVTKKILKQSQSTIKKKAIAGDLVECHLICRHYDNAIIESSYDDKEPRTFSLFVDETVRGVPRAKRYVQGLHEALSSMCIGEIACFAISPEKAYGRKGRYPTIPGFSKAKPRGSWLYYEIEIISISEKRHQDINEKQENTLIVREAAYSLLVRPATGFEWEIKEKELSCDYCGKPKRAMHNGRKFQICAQCKQAKYCCRECATLAWKKFHRQECAPPHEDHDVLQALDEHNFFLTQDDSIKTNEISIKSRNEKIAAALVPLKNNQRPPRIALIVAYRNQLPLQDRQAQLFKFVPYMVAFLGYAEPRCNFKIIVATQTDDGRKFNRGRLMNAAFRDIILPEKEQFDSVIFHDVDILPSEELMSFYAVPPRQKRPLHLAGAWKTKYRDTNFYGGAIAIRPDDFIATNGFPNDCWGWGLDDAEFALRMKAAGLRILRPPQNLGSYIDLDPINLHNIVFSDERGYYHEYWNMDMENGKCKPKIFGPIDWKNQKYGKSEYWQSHGLADIHANSTLVARTEEFNGRVIRLLYALENAQEQKESVTALISAREGLKVSLDNPMLTGPVAANALAQTNELARQGNLAHRASSRRIPTNNLKLISPEDRFRLQGGKAPIPLLQSKENDSLITTSNQVQEVVASINNDLDTTKKQATEEISKKSRRQLSTVVRKYSS